MDEHPSGARSNEMPGSVVTPARGPTNVEHLSGLRDGIAERFGLRRVPNLWVWNADDEYHDGVPFGGWQRRGEGYRSGGDAPLNESDLPVYVFDPDAFITALCVVSEGEIDACRAVARDFYWTHDAADRLVDEILTASRGALLSVRSDEVRSIRRNSTTSGRHEPDVA